MQVAIFQPIRIVAAGARRTSGSGALAIDDGDRGFVGLDDVIPHSQGEKNMRGHVLGVARFRCELRVDACGTEAERRVDGVVIAVDEVVNDAGMTRMLWEGFFEDCGGAHVSGKVAAAFRAGEDRERVEGGGIDVVGIILVEVGHGGCIFLVAIFFAAFAVENLDGGEILLFARRGGFGLAGFGSGGEFLQNFAGGVEILIVPDTVIFGHGFTPVSHGEVGVDFLGAAKM